MEFSEIEKKILCTVSDISDVPENAYNFRVNGKSVSRKSTENINIIPKTDGSGLDIYIKAGSKDETVHIPVVISVTGLSEVVYNDFHVGEGAEVSIIAGCGIYNCGGTDSRHDGVHRFFVEKNAKVNYVEKHFGFGPGAGKVLNPTTEVYLGENSEAYFILEQIKGVDSSIRKTTAELGENAKFLVKERVFSHGNQTVESKYHVLLGENSRTDIVSRSVASDNSRQKFSSKIVGEKKCYGHSECDAILTDQGQVFAEPSLEAKSVEAELFHEASIGKIAGEQIYKLMSLGLTREEAEAKIINGFMK